MTLTAAVSTIRQVRTCPAYARVAGANLSANLSANQLTADLHINGRIFIGEWASILSGSPSSIKGSCVYTMGHDHWLQCETDFRYAAVAAGRQRQLYGCSVVLGTALTFCSFANKRVNCALSSAPFHRLTSRQTT